MLRTRLRNNQSIFLEYSGRSSKKRKRERERNGGERRNLIFFLVQLNCVCEYFEETLFTFLRPVFQGNIAAESVKIFNTNRVNWIAAWASLLFQGNLFGGKKRRKRKKEEKKGEKRSTRSGLSAFIKWSITGICVADYAVRTTE